MPRTRLPGHIESVTFVHKCTGFCAWSKRPGQLPWRQ